MKKRVFDDHYEDILYLPHHVSKNRTPMPIADRAAQFSPFAALTGHNESIKEAKRLTEEKIQLDEHQKVFLDEKLQWIQKHLNDRPEIIITYFLADRKKAGGSYEKIEGIVKRIDEIERCIRMMDGSQISLDDIFHISLKGDQL